MLAAMSLTATWESWEALAIVGNVQENPSESTNQAKFYVRRSKVDYVDLAMSTWASKVKNKNRKFTMPFSHFTRITVGPVRTDGRSKGAGTPRNLGGNLQSLSKEHSSGEGRWGTIGRICGGRAVAGG